MPRLAPVTTHVLGASADAETASRAARGAGACAARAVRRHRGAGSHRQRGGGSVAAVAQRVPKPQSGAGRREGRHWRHSRVNVTPRGTHCHMQHVCGKNARIGRAPRWQAPQRNAVLHVRLAGNTPPRASHRRHNPTAAPHVVAIAPMVAPAPRILRSPRPPPRHRALTWRCRPPARQAPDAPSAATRSRGARRAAPPPAPQQQPWPQPLWEKRLGAGRRLRRGAGCGHHLDQGRAHRPHPAQSAHDDQPSRVAVAVRSLFSGARDSSESSKVRAVGRHEVSLEWLLHTRTLSGEADQSTDDIRCRWPLSSDCQSAQLN